MRKQLLTGFMALAFHAQAQVSVDPGTTVGATGTVQFTYNGSTVTLSTVRAADNNIWLRQNLGSTQVATAQNDAASYGHYFQFGRWDDGHQVPTSTVALASTLSPNNPSGLGTGSANYYNGFWTGGISSNTWSGTTPTATNGKDPCTALGTGWRLPTAAEWTAVKTAEGMDGNWNAATIPVAYFNSNLKLSRAGQRIGGGSFNYIDGVVAVWSSSLSGTNQPELLLSGLGFNYVGNPGIARDAGASCRCIKTVTTLPPTGCTGAPTAPVMSALPTSLCSGGTTLLAATDPNIPVAGITYQWEQSATGLVGSWSNVTGGSGATTLNYTTASLTATTYFRIVATCTSAVLSTPSTSVLITVNPQLTPSVTIAADATGSICEGTAVTFTATPVNGGSTPVYQWKKGTVNVGTGGSTYTDNTLTTTDVISCELISNAACTSVTPVTSNTITFTVNPVVTPSVIISATPATGVCAGASVAFEATQINGGNTPGYQWFNGTTAVGSNAAAFSYVPANGDVISCVLTSDAECASAATATSNEIITLVHPLPAKPIVSASGEVLHSDAGSGNQWYRNNTIINGAVQQNYTATETGYYQVEVTDANGCSSRSDSFFYEPVTSVSRYQTGIFATVYPSPFSNNLNIRLQDVSGTLKDPVRVTIMNQLGQVVHLAAFTGNIYEAALSSLSPGLYFLKLVSPKGELLIKVIKE